MSKVFQRGGLQRSQQPIPLPTTAQVTGAGSTVAPATSLRPVPRPEELGSSAPITSPHPVLRPEGLGETAAPETSLRPQPRPQEEVAQPEPTTEQPAAAQEVEEQTPTQTAETAADQQGSDSNPEQTTQECSGWIAVRSHYADFNLAAVGGRVTISKLENGQATQILQEEVNYTSIATNGLFVSRRPVARPTPVDAALEGGPAVPAATISQAQEATTAGGNGNPLVLLGGEDGLEPGQYRVTFRPNVRHGKLRIDPNPITQGDNAGRYKIIPTDGVLPTEWTAANTTDQYFQVPSTTTVNEEWSQDIAVLCRSKNQPSIVEFQWTDFKANPFQNDRSEGRLRTLHPNARHTFFCFVNKCEEIDRAYVVLSGLRGPEEQDDLYCRDFRTSSRNKSAYCLARGFTDGRQSWRSNARAWQSNHNYGVAIDMQDFNAPNWVEEGIPSTVAGTTVANAFSLEWGRSFGDYPHFQLANPGWRTLRDARGNPNRVFTYDENEYVSY